MNANEHLALDTRECTEHYRYNYYVIVNKKGQVICDTFNSEVQEIHSDVNDSQSHSWDAQGKKDLGRLVDCHNAMAGIENPQQFMACVAGALSAWSLGGSNASNELHSAMGRLWQVYKAAMPKHENTVSNNSNS